LPNITDPGAKNPVPIPPFPTGNILVGTYRPSDVLYYKNCVLVGIVVVPVPPFDTLTGDIRLKTLDPKDNPFPAL